MKLMLSVLSFTRNISRLKLAKLERNIGVFSADYVDLDC